MGARCNSRQEEHQPLPRAPVAREPPPHLPTRLRPRAPSGTKLKNKRGADLYQFWGDKITDAINEARRRPSESVVVPARLLCLPAQPPARQPPPPRAPCAQDLKALPPQQRVVVNVASQVRHPRPATAALSTPRRARWCTSEAASCLCPSVRQEYFKSVRPKNLSARVVTVAFPGPAVHAKEARSPGQADTPYTTSNCAHPSSSTPPSPQQPSHPPA